MFLVEGQKSVRELINSKFIIERIIHRSDRMPLGHEKEEELNTREFDRIANFKHSDGYLAVVRIPAQEELKRNDNILYLDSIADPGNLGTMVRTADWYGITQVICSADTADIYNPKTVSATMGSLFHISVIYDDGSYLKNLSGSHTIIGSSLNGEDKAQIKSDKNTVLIIGSESHGMSEQTESLCDQLVKIERRGSAESLNAATACGILLDRILSINR